MTSLLEILKQKKQEMANARRGFAARVPPGASRWRFMPAWRTGDEQFWHDFGQHFVKDATGALQASYVCVDKTFGRPCAVCDAVKQAANAATDDATMKIVSDAKSSGRVLVNAIQLDGKDPTKVEVTELAPTVFEALLGILEEWTEAGEPVLGVNGKDILIGRSGTGIGTKYTVQVAAKSLTVPADCEKRLNDLDEYVKRESSEGQMRAINSVRALTGLPAPAGAGVGAAGLPLAARAGMTIEDDSAAVAAPPRRAAPAPAAQEFEDVPDLSTAAAAPPARPAAAAAPAAATVTTGAGHAAAAAAAAAAATEGTGDPELDALLAGLS